MARAWVPVTPVTDARLRHRRPEPGEPKSFEYLIDPANGPQWKGQQPGKPVPYVLRRGEGEHAMLFTDLMTVLLSGDETEGQFGIITADSPVSDGRSRSLRLRPTIGTPSTNCQM